MSQFPHSVVELREEQYGQWSVLSRQSVDPLLVNQVVKAMLSNLHEGQQIVISTFGWGVRIYMSTCFGLFTGGGFTADQADECIMRQFEAYEFHHNQQAAAAFLEFMASR